MCPGRTHGDTLLRELLPYSLLIVGIGCNGNSAATVATLILFALARAIRLLDLLRLA
jgi:hypothetical protein